MTTTDLTTEQVQIAVADGTTMGGYVVRPSGGGPRPGILLIQEIFGVNAHIRDLAERFAREGYAVLAPDLFHRIQPDYQGSYDDVGASIGVAQRYTGEHSEADLKASYDFLRAQPFVQADNIGAVGYCMGGRLAFVANGVRPLRAAVSFYGNIVPDKLTFAESQHGPLLLVWAGNDPYIPVEAGRTLTDSLRKLGKSFVNVEFAGANHGFFCDARGDYNAQASAQAWPLTLAFLKTHLAG